MAWKKVIARSGKACANIFGKYDGLRATHQYTAHIDVEGGPYHIDCETMQKGMEIVLSKAGLFSQANQCQSRALGSFLQLFSNYEEKAKKHFGNSCVMLLTYASNGAEEEYELVVFVGSKAGARVQGGLLELNAFWQNLQ